MSTRGSGIRRVITKRTPPLGFRVTVAGVVDALPGAAFPHVVCNGTRAPLDAAGKVDLAPRLQYWPGMPGEWGHNRGWPCAMPVAPFIIPVMQLVGKAPHVKFLKRGELDAMMDEAGFEEVERFRPEKKLSAEFIVARAG